MARRDLNLDEEKRSYAGLWLLCAALLVAAIGVAVLQSWWRYGRQILSAANLLMAAVYVFWKVPVYIGFVINRQVEWVRSKRDSE